MLTQFWVSAFSEAERGQQLVLPIVQVSFNTVLCHSNAVLETVVTVLI